MNLDEAIQKLQTLPQRVADAGVEIMKDVVPHRSGDLKDSIFSDVDGETVFIGTEIHYAKFVQYGRGEVLPKGRDNGGANILHWKDPYGEVWTKRAGPAKAQDFVGKTGRLLAKMKFL